MSQATQAYTALVNDVRDVLLADWDPNGVGDNPNLRDEYDGYLAAILHCAESSDTEESVFKLLEQIEQDTQMPVSETNRRRAAAAIAKRLRAQ